MNFFTVYKFAMLPAFVNREAFHGLSHFLSNKFLFPDVRLTQRGRPPGQKSTRMFR